MNGRLFDPLMRRFLNADENIQDPYNTQNYNRYGYVLNNPLMYTDPSGESFWKTFASIFVSVAFSAVGIAVGIATGGAIGFIGYVDFNSGDWQVYAAGWGTIAAAPAGGFVNFGQTDGQFSFYGGVKTAPKFLNPDNKPKSDINGVNQGGQGTNSGANGNGGGQGGNLSPAQQAQIKAREHHSFFGANVKFNAYQSGLDVYNSTYFGTIHTSRATFNDYLMKGRDSQGGHTLMHEYGHYLHAQSAPLNFYSYALWSSAWTANSSSPMSNWTEIKANTMSYYYFGQPSYWRQKENPTNSNYLSKQEIFRLTHHLKPFNRFRP